MIDYDVLCEAIKRWKTERLDLGRVSSETVGHETVEATTEPMTHQALAETKERSVRPEPPRPRSVEVPVVSTPERARTIWRRHERKMATRLYELMAIALHDLKLGGLWTDGRNLCIVCDDPSGPHRINAWWQNNSVTTIPYLSIVEIAPDGYQFVARGFHSVVAAQEWARTWDDLLLELATQLPRDTPRFCLNRVSSEDQLPLLQLSFAGPLIEQQRSAVETVIDNSSHTLVDEIAYDYVPLKSAPKNIEPHSSNPLVLHASRSLEGKISAELSRLYEMDEDLWLSSRYSIFGTNGTSPENLPPHLVDPSKSRCLVDCRSFEPSDLSNYLLMYDQVILPLPSNIHYESVMRALGVKDHELLALARQRRVIILLPMPINNYKLSLLEDLSEQVPESLVFSRSLLAATVLDSRIRAPHLYPPFSPDSKRAFLAYLSEESRKTPTLKGLNTKILLDAVVAIYDQVEERLHAQGSMALAIHGLGTWAHALYRGSSPDRARQELAPEFTISGMAVQWAAALDAVLFPAERGDYSLAPMSNYMSQVYRREFGSVFSMEEAKMIQLVQKQLLRRSEGQSVQEFGALLGTLGKQDVDRIRKVISNLVLTSTSTEDLEASIGKLNEEVAKMGAKLKAVRAVADTIQIAVSGTVLLTVNPYVMPFAFMMLECLKRAGFHETVARKLSKATDDAVLISQTRAHFQ